MNAKHLVIAVALLDACATNPEKARAEAGRLAGSRIEHRVAWEQGTPEDAAVERRVRELLSRELVADAAVEIALVRNPELLATLENLGIAQADLVEAGLLKNLHVGGGPRFPFSGNAIGWEGDLAIAFFDTLLIPLRKKAAKAHLREVTLRVAHAVLELDMHVRQSVYEAIAAERVLELRRSAAELAAAAAELGTRQVEAGAEGTMTQLARAELITVEAAARIELQQAQVQAVQTREHLVRLLGLWGDDVDFRLPTSLPKLPELEPELGELERVALRRRFDLQAERAELDALANAVKIARRLPFVQVDAGVIGEADPGDRPTLGPFFELQIPIFNWGQADIARAEATLRQVERHLRGMAIDARSEVRVARTKMVTERRLAEYERDTVVPVRMQMVGLGQERYDGMLLGVYELIELKVHELEARAELVEHFRDYWTARAELELAIGGRLSTLRPRAAANGPSATVPPGKK